MVFLLQENAQVGRRRGHGKISPPRDHSVGLGGKMPARRTTMYSSKGKKLYAVRDAKGRFKDIQQYSRAHAMDMRRKSKAELEAAAKKAGGKKKAAPKKKAAKKK
jgi:hypothetical protein